MKEKQIIQIQIYGKHLLCVKLGPEGQGSHQQAAERLLAVNGAPVLFGSLEVARK